MKRARCEPKGRTWTLSAWRGSRARSWKLSSTRENRRPQTPEELLAQEPGFAAFADVREDVVASLLGSVRERIACELTVILFFDRLDGGISPKKALEIADYYETLAYSADVAANERSLRRSPKVALTWDGWW